jgi:hypothetical protein
MTEFQQTEFIVEKLIYGGRGGDSIVGLHRNQHNFLSYIWRLIESKNKF